MALTPIPNQPYIFTTDSQPCLITDNVGYRQMVQPGDLIKIQLINEPCGGELLCDATAATVGENIVANGGFDSGSDWTLLSMNASIGAGKLNINAISGSTQTHATQSVVDTNNCGATVFTYSFTISGVTGGATILLADGANTIYSGVAVNGIVSGQYISAAAGTFDVVFSTVGTGTGTFSIDDVSFIPYNIGCWCIETNTSSWSFAVVNGKGEFTHSAGDTFYFGAFLIPEAPGLITYRVQFKIKNLTTGTITPAFDFLGLCPVASANGQYDETVTVDISYGSLIAFTPSIDFDGTIYDFSVTHSVVNHVYDIVRVDQGSSDVVSDQMAVEVVNDRIDIIYDPENNIFEGEPLPLVEGGCYRVRIYDACTDDEQPGYVTSTIWTYGDFDCTVLVEASCDEEGLGFDFSGNFTLVQRLKMVRFGAHYSNSGGDYDGSNGRKYTTLRKAQKTFNALFNYMDEPTIDALNAQINCDTLTIDAEEWFAPVQDVETDYGVRGRRNLSQVEIELCRKDSVIYNRNNI